MIAYLLAIASPSSRISPWSWNTWALTYTVTQYNGYIVLENPLLLVHQMPHLWLDLKTVSDQYVDYYDNAILATFLNREYSIKQNNYPNEVWGISACYGPEGYVEYKSPPPAAVANNDGTICPSAVLGSLVLTPELSFAALASFQKNYGSKVWGVYGFIESFNPQKQYFKQFYTAQSIGTSIVQIENYRTHLIQRLFMQNEFIRSALHRIGFE
jgi:hypothetical protein